MQVKYGFNESKQFIIENYDKSRTFASFLPGIAGIDGIPMWSFYVNRGQVMGSFGVKDRDNTIMEFFPANVMYKNIERQGFRTFIKYNGRIHEIFASVSADETKRTLLIEKNIVRIIEVNKTLGLKVTVTYFTMPRESYAAIVRKVEIENLDVLQKDIELLDGIPQILPFGVSNASFQESANLIKAWFDVFNTENRVPYYMLRASTADTVEIDEYEQGNFYLSFSSESDGLIAPLYDMNVIFGENTSLSKPDGWDCPLKELAERRQVSQNKVSGGFSGAATKIGKNKFVLCTLIGHIQKVELINGIKDSFTVDFINKKEKEAACLVDSLVKNVYTKTSDDLFNAYIEQCYLDNLLRGGYPLIFKNGSGNHVYHVYSRKHGDLEREYNFFSLEPAYYSQGNGNFRDVNQNRRCDVLINPEVGDFNIRHFMNLIQADGYNPLSVKGCTFTFDMNAWGETEKFINSHRDEIKKLLASKFTPGKLIACIAENDVSLAITKADLLGKVLENSTQNFEAEFGEGYWSDHWTYNMDLVESCLRIYPDMEEDLLFGEDTCSFFYSPVYVLPRQDKYVLAKGRVRQYGAVYHEKTEQDSGWLKTENGHGRVYKTSLYVKLVSLALNKFACLDPYGMGIEMEGGKPGWNDAMNGLPGLFGSSLCETAELLRIVNYVIKCSSLYGMEVSLPEEMAELSERIERTLIMSLAGNLNDYEYWDIVSAAREEYRSKIRYGIKGTEHLTNTGKILALFQIMKQKLDRGMEKALSYGSDGVYPTYFTYNAVNYETLEGRFSPVNGYQNVRVTAFECRPLPAFLEGPARILKATDGADNARRLYKAVKSSDIYDKKLKMYKTSVSLEKESSEIGRLKAFTPGWLEREAVFLHMEYKYLYAMLQAGLYDEFFNDIKTALVPFMKPEVYGRSTLENVSFIASSANPDEAIHGRGFVARLTGSTAEMLSMWFLMMAGRNPFIYEEGQFSLILSPLLPCWLFDKQGRVSFNFLGRTKVSYINPHRKNTYGEDGVKPEKYVLTNREGKTINIEDCRITGRYAYQIRDGEITSIDVFLK
ncbi:MAG TPA: cellobiose phosphorylase [Ruminiclostridium sp.]|nr:cellobiose phosphorylase [Ruminiclostridium sp.]